MPGFDGDADQVLVSVEDLGKLLQRALKTKLLDAIDRHGPTSDNVGSPVRVIDSSECRIGAATHRHLRCALDRHPGSVMQIHCEPVTRLVADAPAFNSEAAGRLAGSDPLLHVNCGQLGVSIGARDTASVGGEGANHPEANFPAIGMPAQDEHDDAAVLLAKLCLSDVGYAGSCKTRSGIWLRRKVQQASMRRGYPRPAFTIRHIRHVSGHAMRWSASSGRDGVFVMGANRNSIGLVLPPGFQVMSVVASVGRGAARHHPFPSEKVRFLSSPGDEPCA
jgi:hypothetical protein